MVLNKHNRGKVSIFLCILVSGMVLLSTASLQIIGLFNAKAKTAMVAKGTISSVKAQYNNYIFEKYHILLLDKDCGGKGEAYLEQLIYNQLSDNLGAGYTVNMVALTEGKTIVDDDAKALKKQVEEYMPYLMVDYSVEKIISATKEKDGSIDNEILDKLDNEHIANVVEPDKTNVDEIEPEIKFEDPRKFIKGINKGGLLLFLKPADMNISSEKITLKGVPSRECKYDFDDIKDFKYDFTDLNTLKTLLTANSKWASKLRDGGEGAIYARSVFNCATNQSVNEDSVFKCELEYIIAGKKSDYDNLECVAKQIILIRFPIDFVFLMKDEKKQEEIEIAADLIAMGTGAPPEVTGVLITGAWSYVEAMADVKQLLKGRRIAFVKSEENWITDLENLSNSFNLDQKEDEYGLCYEDYLVILMALNTNKLYYRMLDLMQINAAQQNDSFRIKNCFVWLGTDYEIEYMGKTIRIHEEDGY